MDGGLGLGLRVDGGHLALAAAATLAVPLKVVEQSIVTVHVVLVLAPAVSLLSRQG